VTLHECVAHAGATLFKSGLPSEDARRDAVLLARFVLGWSLAEWLARAWESAPAGFDRKLAALIARRARHEPMAYLTGTREFYGRDFRVTPATLIPRPETEGLVEAAIEIAGSLGSLGSAGPLIIDVGTGSGCIAITLALEVPGARVIATDVSAEALDAARANATALGAGNVRFHQVSNAAFFPPALPHAQLIVSNPPYVAERDRASLTADVNDFEPASALFAGDDGLDVIRALVPAATQALAEDGALVMEIGAGQADAVSAIVTRAGLRLDSIRPDLHGIPRVVVAHRRA